LRACQGLRQAAPAGLGYGAPPDPPAAPEQPGELDDGDDDDDDMIDLRPRLPVRDRLVLPSAGGTSTPDAWLYMSHMTPQKASMYRPMLVSVEEALHRVGASVAVIDRLSDEALLSGVSKAVARGRRPLVVTIGAYWARPTSKTLLQACSDSGAYIVVYQSEPGAHAAQQLADELRAHEVWDYSLANIQRYDGAFRSRVPVRYMPPGYSPSFELGLNLASPSRQLRQVGFLGTIRLRPKYLQELYRTTLGDRLVDTTRTWTEEDLRQFLERFPLQLNVHKRQTCCPHSPDERAPMEAFRLAILLSSGACVVSTPVAEEDEANWRGLVRFAEANETLRAIDEIAADPAAVLACQRRTKQLFKQRFDPKDILINSGFLDVWQHALHRGKT